MRRYSTFDSHNSQVKIQGALTIGEVMSRAIIRNYFAATRYNVLHCQTIQCQNNARNPVHNDDLSFKDGKNAII